MIDEKKIITILQNKKSEFDTALYSDNKNKDTPYLLGYAMGIEYAIKQIKKLSEKNRNDKEKSRN